MLRLLFFILLTATIFRVEAQDRWLYWKYKDFDGGINFSIPRLLIGTGAAFLEEREDRKMMRRLHKVRTLIFEEGSPLSERDIRKFTRKARRRHLDEILTVREGKTHVRILAKERRSVLRKVVVFVSSPEDGFVMVSLKGKLRLDDINKALRKIKKDEEHPDKVLIPDFIKIPSESI